MRGGKFLKFVKKAALSVIVAIAAFIAGDIALRAALREKRPLTPAQIGEAKTIFGNTIDYAKVRVSDSKISSFQSECVITLGNTIHYPPPDSRYTSMGYTTSTPSKNLFLHEMTHIWQNQNNIKGTGLSGAFALWVKSFSDENVYEYQKDSAKSLTHYNMEQQASLIADYATLKSQWDNIPGQNPPEEYVSLKTIVGRSIITP